MRQCTICKENKELKEFYKSNTNKSGFRGPCISCTLKKGKTWAQENKQRKYESNRARKIRNPLICLLTHARLRASKQDIPFDISIEDIKYTGYCACCHKKLSMGIGRAHEGSPSIDKIIPALGYVPGNCQIICWRCNIKKNDMSLFELELLAAYIKKYSDSSTAC